MNKQEVIMKLEEKDNNAYEKQQAYLTGSTLFQRYEAQRIAYRTAINYVERLDEPQKVKVPQFVAEYLEAHRKWGPEIFIGDWLADNDAVYKWLYNNSEKENNRRFLIAVKAFVEGYEVEKEPRWVVMQGGSEVWYLQGFRNSLDGDIVKQWCSYEGCIKFTDRKKAEAVATLVDGSVEEV